MLEKVPSRKWETGMIENMGRDKIVALSKILDVSPLAEILGIPETEETPFVVPTNIMNIYKQLTTEEIKKQSFDTLKRN